MRDITKRYTNGEVTVVWKPEQCIHSTMCWKGLGEVFNPKIKPWIKVENADTARVVEQIKKCPSGALSYYMNAEMEKETVEVSAETIIEPTPNGPLLVYGNVKVKDASGNETKKSNVTAFCRCGASSNKPYCDGTHHKISFEG